MRLLEGTEVPAAAEGHRLVLIDTPPGLSAIDSLREADLLVVPVLPEEQGVANLVRYLRLIEGQRIEALHVELRTQLVVRRTTAPPPA